VFEVAVGRSHHDHLICERCGRIVEFVTPEVERLQDEIAAAHGFIMNRHRHELRHLRLLSRSAQELTAGQRW